MSSVSILLMDWRHIFSLFIPNIFHLCFSGYPEYSASKIDLHGAVGERLRESAQEQHQRSPRAVSCVLLYFHLLPVTIGKSPRSSLICAWLSFSFPHSILMETEKPNRSLFYVFLIDTVYLKVHMCPGLSCSANWIVTSATADLIQQPLRFCH